MWQVDPDFVSQPYPALAFINKFKPPGLDDFTFVDVDDSVDGHAPCWNAPAFTTSPAPRLESDAATVASVAASVAAAGVLAAAPRGVPN